MNSYLCRSLRIINEDIAGLLPLCPVDYMRSCSPNENLSPMPLQTISKRQHVIGHAVTQSSPSAALSFIENAPQGGHVIRISVADSDKQLYNEPSMSKVLQDVHIESGTFYVTTLIIPNWDSTSGSCQAINEEEVFAIQNEQSLVPVGWIHTHPSQSCFMSSVDLHTHYSYQVMVPEAFAIVLAPTDSSRSNGIFWLTAPAGMSVLKECQETGFHPHEEPADGSPIYEHCSNVYKNSNLRFEIFDLR